MNNDESFDQIPDDFPRAEIAASVAGAQEKLPLVEYQGKFYISGSSPPERFQRWETCEELAQHLRTKSLESKAGKRSHMSDTQILSQYYVRLQETGWTSEAESIWVMHRTALLLEWKKLDI